MKQIANLAAVASGPVGNGTKFDAALVMAGGTFHRRE